MYKQILKILLLAACVSILAGCATSVRQVEAASDRLSVVATIFPLYDFARAVVNEDVALTMMLSPGMDIHAFDPSPADIISIQNADVFIYIGGESESWVDGILASMDLENKKILRLIEYIDISHNHHHSHHHDHGHSHHHDIDEHIWTSPYNAALMVQAIADILAEADEANANYFMQNAANYIRQILDLDAAFKLLAESAEDPTIIVGDRFPFRYFVDRYGISYYSAFEGCGVGLDPSPAIVAQLVNVVRERSAEYIFHIESSRQNITDIIANETGAEALLLHSVQNVSWEEWEAGETYLSLMQENLHNLRRGFGIP